MVLRYRSSKKMYTVSMQKVLKSYIIVIIVLLLLYCAGEKKSARNNAINDNMKRCLDTCTD